LVKVEQGDSGYLNFYANGFDHLSGTELEQKQKKKAGVHPEQAEASVDTLEEPQNFIDLEEDLRASTTPNSESAGDVLDEL